MEIYERPLTFKQASSYCGRETKRRRRIESEKIEIPNDVVEEIMLKLPVASVRRFQIVTKQWKSLIRSKDFEERYMDHQKRKDPKLLFVWDDLVDQAQTALHLRSMALETTSSSLEEARSLEYENFNGYLEISESCDGLVCIYGLKKAVKVINPATAMLIALPQAKIQRLFIQHREPEASEQDPSPVPVPFTSFTRLGFGKDSFTGRYKLVWLYNKYPPASSSLISISKKKVRCEVLDLKQQKWRFVSTTPLDDHHILCNQRPAFANGSFYWLTGDEEGDPKTQTKLIVFDIHTEMFQVTATPPFISRDAYGDRIGVCNLNARLCISELKGDCKQEFWWNNNNTWEKIFTVDLRSTSTWFAGITSEPLTPLAITRDNKVILSLCYQENLVAFDLDPHSRVYHLYFLGYYGLAVPYFPSLLLERKQDFSVY